MYGSFISDGGEAAMVPQVVSAVILVPRTETQSKDKCSLTPPTV